MQRRDFLLGGGAILLAGCQSDLTPVAAGGPVAQTPVAVSSSNSLFESLLNSERQSRGLARLSLDPQLSQAATAHARDMARQGYFSHKSQNGRSFSDRIRATGYCRTAMAENIAQGQPDEATVFATWMNSSAHRRNMLNRGFRKYGLAQVDRHWVMTMAGACV